MTSIRYLFSFRRLQNLLFYDSAFSIALIDSKLIFLQIMLILMCFLRHIILRKVNCSLLRVLICRYFLNRLIKFFITKKKRVKIPFLSQRLVDNSFVNFNLLTHLSQLNSSFTLSEGRKKQQAYQKLNFLKYYSGMNVSHY